MHRPHPLRSLSLLLLLATPAALAQEPPVLDPGEGRTRRTETTNTAPIVLRTPDATVTLGAQIVAGAETPIGTGSDTDAFRLAAARASLRARVGERYGLYLRTDLTRTPAVLDAELSARLTDGLRIDVGRFKTPFSHEFIRSRSGLDFTSRARVNALVPGRRNGVEARLDLVPDDALAVTVGLFDGRGPDSVTSGGARLAVARVQAFLPASVVRATGLRGLAGLNVAHEGADAFVRTGVTAARRTLVGADARLRLGRVVVSGEWIAETLRDPAGPNGGAVDIDGRSGYHATVAADLTDDLRLLARLDRFEGTSEVIGGVNASLTPAVTVQVNTIVPAVGTAPGRRHTRLAATAQIVF